LFVLSLKPFLSGFERVSLLGWVARLLHWLEEASAPEGPLEALLRPSMEVVVVEEVEEEA
jgi:hypothetical protein